MAMSAAAIAVGFQLELPEMQQHDTVKTRTYVPRSSAISGEIESSGGAPGKETPENIIYAAITVIEKTPMATTKFGTILGGGSVSTIGAVGAWLFFAAWLPDSIDG
jgi:hypothetical protein